MIMKRFSAIVLSFILAASLAACGNTDEGSEATLDISSDATITENSANEADPSGNEASASEAPASATDDEKVSVDTYVVLNDDATTIKGAGASFKDGTLTISEPGAYSIKGKLTDGSIFVNINKDKKVKLLFDGVDIHSSQTAPVYVEEGGKETKIVLMNRTENLLSDSAGRTSDKDDPDYASAAIYSKDDLEICGSGSLKVEANFGRGIFSKNDLQQSGGTVTVNSADDAFRGKESVEISGGELSIDSGNDGVSSNASVTISGGRLTVGKSSEGIEGETVEISGGYVSLTSSDDGINASGDGTSDNDARGVDFGGSGGSSSNPDAAINITGGEIYINSVGDGIDSNGSINMTDGLAVIFGPTSDGDTAFDCQMEASITGGTLLAVGSAGMVEGIGNSSPYIAANVDISASSLVTISDEGGSSLIAFTTPKDIRSIIFRSDDIVDGREYTVSTGGSRNGENINGVFINGETTGATEVATVKASKDAVSGPSNNKKPF